MIGKNHKGAFVTLDERKSKLRLAMPVSSKKAREVTDAMVYLLKPIKQFVKTITFDNGKEFTLHEEVARQVGVMPILQNLTIPGNVVRMKMLMDC